VLVVNVLTQTWYVMGNIIAQMALMKELVAVSLFISIFIKCYR
jgi:hypothetical protein